MKNKNQIYVPLLASAILIMILIAKAIDVSLLTRENEYVGIIILEVMIFAFPCIIFTRLFPQKPGNTLKISLFGADKLFLAFTASVLLISGSLLYVFLINGINGTDSVFTLYDVFTAKKTDAFSGNLFLILAYALIPAVFEEFAFRGVICSAYEEHSPIYSILMSSVFFGMIHFDIRMLPFYILAGSILGTVLYASGSSLAAIAVHFIFNLFFIYASDYANAFIVADKNFSFFTIGLLFFISAFIFCGECRSIYKRKAENTKITESDQKVKVNALEIILSPTAVICYLIYFAVEFLK